MNLRRKEFHSFLFWGGKFGRYLARIMWAKSQKLKDEVLLTSFLRKKHVHDQMN